MNKSKPIICLSIIPSILLMSNCWASTHSAANLNNDIYLLKMGVAGINDTHSHFDITPSIGLAKRFEINEAAIEVSVNYAGSNNNTHSSKQLSFPKIIYLMFHDVNNPSSFYYGGGLSWSKTKRGYRDHSNTDSYFEGIFLEGTAGYEIHRDQKIRTTFELNISQPIIANSHQGSQPGPSVFANIGFGFF